MMVGAKLARGDLDSVWSEAWKRAMGISGALGAHEWTTGAWIAGSWVEKIAAGVEAVQRNGKAAAPTGRLAHDVSIVLGVGRRVAAFAQHRPSLELALQA